MGEKISTVNHFFNEVFCGNTANYRHQGREGFDCNKNWNLL